MCWRWWSLFDLDFDFDRDTAKFMIDVLAILGTVGL